MSTLLVWWVWFAAAVFLLGCAWRAWRYASAPVHLRWDLYPVAHEPAARRAHGGSYLEEREWWSKPRHRSLLGEATTMAGEIFLLHGVWRHNRRVFWGSFPFHWGLYLLTFTSAGIAVRAAGWSQPALDRLLAWTGSVGGVLVAAGALGLLWLRAADAGLRRYTTVRDRINLGIFALLGFLSAAVALSAGGLDGAAAAVARIVRFEPAAASPLLAAQMAVAALVLTYLPFTRMVHFFAKYFLYHDVRWDDRPLEIGSPMERRVRAALEFGVGWSGEHIGDGTWARVATSAPPDRKAKP